MVCIACCSKLNQTSEFFETSLRAQTVLQMTAGIQKGATADGVGVRNVVTNITFFETYNIHFRCRRLNNFHSSLSVFTVSESARYQRFC
jgi:hypothetical protein